MRRVLPLLLLPLLRCSCDDGLSAGSDCRNGSDCSAGLVCPTATSVCTPNVACTGSAECGSGARCVAGACEQSTSGAPCASSTECIAGETCRSNGTCAAPGGEGSACSTGADCESGLVCDPSDGTCQGEVSCTMNRGCGKGAICESGSCEQNVSGGPCAANDDCIAGEGCIGGSCVEGCGGELYTADLVPPNLLIVLDRSGSMNEEIAGGDTKWNVARNAINNFFSTYAGQIRFGLSLFPGLDRSCAQGMDCGPGTVNVAIAGGSEPEISDYLMNAGTCMFGTPIAEELRPLVDYAALEDPTRGNFILLVTDGMATCDDPVPEVEALKNQTPEVKTFVVGFGDGVDPDQLEDMAVAGGTARSGTPAYYQADDPASLRAAFASIAGQVLSCEYTLSEIPPDPDQLYVYFNGSPVARDTTRNDGWDHAAGTNRLTFYGSACEELQSGRVTELVIVYGCPLAPPPPPPNDGGVPGNDGGLDPMGMGCSSCTQCGSLGCVGGTCGPCGGDFDCCLGSICVNQQCVPDL